MQAFAADELAIKTDAAFLVAARKVIEDARRAEDGVLIWRDERVTEISCEEAEQMLAVVEEQTRADQSDGGVDRR